MPTRPCSIRRTARASIIPVTGERLTEVTAHGWGNDHENAEERTTTTTSVHSHGGALQDLQGHCSRISIGWKSRPRERSAACSTATRCPSSWLGPEGSPNTVVEQKVDPNGSVRGFRRGDGRAGPSSNPSTWIAFRNRSHPAGHGNSHSFITHEFISAIVEDRHPEVNAGKPSPTRCPVSSGPPSALAGGACMRIRDYGTAPA